MSLMTKKKRDKILCELSKLYRHNAMLFRKGCISFDAVMELSDTIDDIATLIDPVKGYDDLMTLIGKEN